MIPKKVLLVSPYPYTQTGRGMDVLSGLFEEEGWETTHLTFPHVLYTPKKKDLFSTSVTELQGRFTLIPYIDVLMKWFPRWLFRLYQKYAVSKVFFIDWKSYDYVVLESGKPLFLLDTIPDDVTLIYRQSDSVRMVLGKGKWYIDLEDRICLRAQEILIVKDYYRSSLPESTRDKATEIRNGFAIPNDADFENPYSSESRNAVYVGLTPLDSRTLALLCTKNPDIHLHIFGNCLRPWQLVKLKKYQNFHFYGFQPWNLYMKYLKHADAAIFPFKHFSGMDHVGFTTKYLNFMYFRLPIVSYLTGEKSEFDGLPIRFPENSEEFNRNVRQAVDGGPVEYDFNFEFYSMEGREREYRDFINSLREKKRV